MTIFSFAAISVYYLNTIFTTSLRWGFLILLFASLLARGQLMLPLRLPFMPMLLLYMFWCLGTTLWSDVPQLTFLKAAAFGLTAWTFLAAGMAWAQHAAGEHPVNYLLPNLLLALFASMAGTTGFSVVNAELTVYEGLTGSANQLAIMTASALPFVLYHAFTVYDRRRPMRRLLAMITLMLVTLVMWWAKSRASILCAMTIFFFFVQVVDARRFTRLAVLAGLTLLIVVGGSPTLRNAVTDQIVVKGNEQGDIFASRREPWERTYEGAIEGGAVGVGYGVSAGIAYIETGDSSIWRNLAANDYGREKGNSQLAIWEETGLIGLGLYAILIVQVLSYGIAGMRRATVASERLQLGLLVGAAVGLLLQSIFEAWWTAPGAVESAYFWSAVGVTCGIIQRHLSVSRRLLHLAGSAPPQPALSTAE